MPRAELLNELRYAERLCQRTARLYRRLQAFGTFATIVGGSATLGALSSTFPQWASVAGAVTFTVFGAVLIAIRPADKVAANEADAKRYSRLRAEAGNMDDAALQAALNKARESDTPEVEPLRMVAFNDVLDEIGRSDEAVKLTPVQRLVAVLA